MSLQGLLVIAALGGQFASWGYILWRTSHYDSPSSLKVVSILCLPLIPCAIGLVMSVLGYDIVLTYDIVPTRVA